MNGLDLLIDEHKYIKRMLIVMRSASLKILEGHEIDYLDFNNMIDFVRNFADEHHHGKEEKFLFNKMMEELGSLAEKLIRSGMLVEHDLGRLYILQLEEALEKVKYGDNDSKIDVIANAVGYANLLTRHIDKEDNVVFTFAHNQLSQGSLTKFNENCINYELTARKLMVQDKYLQILESLEKKYSYNKVL